MRKPAFFFILFLSAALSFSQEFIDVDFYRDLTDTINHFDLSNLSDGTEGVLLLPSVYLSKRFHTYASFGVMFNNPFLHNPEYENEEMDINENHPTTIFKAALALRRRKTTVMLYFDYHSDYSWGLSFKLKF